MRHSACLAALALAVGRAAADAYAHVEYGNMFYLGPTTAGQYITRATYSLVPPAPPTDWAKADEDMTFLALWIGVQDNPNAVASVLNEDFVQPVLMWAPVQSNQGCPADVGHFCAATSTYTPQGQVQQPYTAVPSGATVDFEIALNASTDKIDQRVYLNGELISEQSDSKGMRPAVFYSGNECYYEACGTLPEYSEYSIYCFFFSFLLLLRRWRRDF